MRGEDAVVGEQRAARRGDEGREALEELQKDPSYYPLLAHVAQDGAKKESQ